ncbi:MAG: hypothetical protein MUE94_05125 [Verrucomicrobia bacterium]|jgi:hypothetical protein|nr:hypothetical protein [Verrucomicrobiota bacterium]
MTAPAPILPKERELLRRLAARVREIAGSDENRQKTELAKKTNALKAERRIIFTHPENAWSEIIPPGSLECHSGLLRPWEFQLKQRVFWTEQIRCDRSAHPYLEGSRKISWGNGWGLEFNTISAGHLNLEIILKDTPPINRGPHRLGRWVQIAR